ncbi:MFS transporter [Natrinema salifodinae]|uniref:Sugar phosphate permease n=1 Tax=Natrinema salifodinae TaxID=1202768 RepID=A0A1I0MDG1_9EURY|nr:MFS transporter [Natrinema salifodinae]SEV86497.1 Sugar phosphate permease [Natrinema salifodinae]
MDANDRSIISFVMLSHAIVHTYELSIPILMLLWVDAFSISIGSLAVVVSAGYAMFGLGALPTGVLADVYGSRTLIVCCLVGMSASFLLVSAAPTLHVLVLALVCWGIAASIYHPAGLSLISTGVVDRGTAFAYHGVAGNAGIALGPLVTALLLLVVDWRLVTVLLSLPSLVVAGYALTVRFDEHAGANARRADADESAAPSASSLSELWAGSKALFATGFALVFVIVMLSGLFYRGTLTLLPEILTTMLEPSIGDLRLFDPNSALASEFEPSRYFYTGLLLVGIGGQYVGGKLTDRLPTERGLVVAFGSLAVIALAFVPAARAGAVSLALVSAALGFVLFLIQPLYQATIARYSPANARGLSYGFTYVGTFGVGALGAALTGVVYDGFGIVPMFATLAGVAVLACLLSGSLLVTGDAANGTRAANVDGD